MPPTMTGRERMLTAFRCGKADTVPVSPDISAMVPVRLSGKPFDEMFLDGKPHNGYASASVALAYVDAIQYYGLDGWYIYGSMREISPEDRPHWQSRLERLPEGGQRKYELAQTPYGEVTKKTLYPTGEPPWEEEKPVKDLRRDWPRLRAMMGEDGEWCWEKHFEDCDRIGELGVYSVAIGIPQDWWFFQRDGGYNVMFYDYMDDPAYIDEIFEFYGRYALARVEAACQAGADEIMLGGSASSLSVSSPKNFRKYDLPFIQKAAEICKRYGVFSHLHVCGRSRKVVEMVCEETEVDVMEPLEEPPGGDVDIAEIKKRYGSKICMKGNINTFEFMLRATPEQVERKAKRLIDDCAADGGFILSTGDQCGRDTPDANLFKLVEVARTYGRYT
ncbi:MAG TPA: uroporphyrinogen decarboxylase family protein [Anaerolineales bacterium]|nr:uroporphyrinogen decarboxylase family protein [Anaerolineales bacterium]